MNDPSPIDRLGGTSKVAKMLGLTTGAVSQWRKNGIPHARLMYLRLLRPDVFEKEQNHTPEQAAA